MATFNSKEPFEKIKFRNQVNRYFMVDFGLPRFSEIDSYQVLWNGHYINYFETARQYYGRHMNLGTAAFERYGFQIPVYSYNVNMRSAVMAGQNIRVGVRPVSFKKGLIDLFHVLLADDEIKAVGHIVHAVVETTTKSIPYPMPPIVTEIVGQFFAPFMDEMEDFGFKPNSASALSFPLQP